MKNRPNTQRGTGAKIVRFLTMICSLALLAGCCLYENVAINASAKFYKPLTSKVYAPKPSESVVPIVYSPPERAYRVIGRIAFENKPEAFVEDALRRNCRRVGADAVYVTRKVTNYRFIDHTNDLKPSIPDPCEAPTPPGKNASKQEIKEYRREVRDEQWTKLSSLARSNVPPQPPLPLWETHISSCTVDAEMIIFE